MSGLRRGAWLVGAVVALGTVAGCHRTFHGSVSQPNPLLHPHEMLRESEPITIVTGDMELEAPRVQGVLRRQRWPLNNVAAFTVVSRDRLRFHVQIEHKWSEWAMVDSWTAYLIDDRGRRYLPEAIERVSDAHVVMMWDYETRSVRRNAFGDIVAIADDGHRRRNPLGSLSVFRGRGDVVFYAHDLFTPDVRSLTLVLERTGVAFAFTWRFAEDAPAPGPGRGAGLAAH
jgi:hypothetical protein